MSISIATMGMFSAGIKEVVVGAGVSSAPYIAGMSGKIEHKRFKVDILSVSIEEEKEDKNIVIKSIQDENMVITIKATESEVKPN